MRQLPLEFTEGGYHYKQERRSDYCAIYRQRWGENGSVAWEVVVPQIRKQTVIDGKWQPCPPYEGYPSTSQWGDNAWTYTDIEQAVERYHSVNENRAELANNKRRKRLSTTEATK